MKQVLVMENVSHNLNLIAIIAERGHMIKDNQPINNHESILHV